MTLNKINNKILEGTFVGYFANDSICASGDAVLMNQQKIMDQKFEDLEKRANETRMQLEELTAANKSKLIASNANP